MTLGFGSMNAGFGGTALQQQPFGQMSGYNAQPSNIYNMQGNSLSDFILQRCCQQGVQSGGFGALNSSGFGNTNMGLGTTAFGAPSTGFGAGGAGFGTSSGFGTTNTGFGVSQPAFGGTTAFGGANTGFGMGNNAFGTMGGFGAQQPQQVTSTAQIDALSQSLDAAKALRSGSILEQLRQELPYQSQTLQILNNASQPQNPAMGAPLEQQKLQKLDQRVQPNTSSLLKSLQSAILEQKQQEIQPTLLQLVDYSHVQQRQNSAFKADFSVQQQNNTISQIGEHQVSAIQAMPRKNPNAPVSKKYTTVPALEQLSYYSDEMLQNVQNFCIYYQKQSTVASLRFQWPVNLLNVNLDEVVILDEKCFQMKESPQTAQLNVPAEVTLFGVYCPPGVSKEVYGQQIKEITARNNGKLVDWNAEQGIWRFTIGGM